MKADTFGSTDQYKMLTYLTEEINKLDKKDKEYISSVIADFNAIIKKFNHYQHFIEFKRYLLDLVFNDYISRINAHLVGKYDEKIITYLKNFIHAKIQNSKSVK